MEFNFNFMKGGLGFQHNIQEKDSHVMITRLGFKTSISLDNFKGC